MTSHDPLECLSMEDKSTVVDYWFGHNPNDAATAKEQSSLWWSKNPAIDAEIRHRFKSLVVTTETGSLDGWKSSIDGVLALILLTDQFPRNIYRDTPEAFRLDPLARKFCKDGLVSRADQDLRPIERVFFYLPLEHSEDPDDQHRCVTLFRELAAEVSAELKPAFDGFVDFALRHKVIIDRFGRFPHRNRILGRRSTLDELEFLQQPDSSF